MSGNPLSFADPNGLRSTGWDWLDKQMQSHDTSKCATAECAAGLLPTQSDNRTYSEAEKSMCTRICDVVETVTAGACGIVSNTVLPGSGLAISAGNLKARSLICTKVCQ